MGRGYYAGVMMRMEREQRENLHAALAHDAAQQEAPERVSGAHLYVMMNQAGLIKIGRSNNPGRRRSQLQCAGGTPVALVLVLENRGHEEQKIPSRVESVS